MDIESDISRAAALIAQGLSLVERIEFADAVRGVSTLEQIPQKYREQISVLIKKKEARHLPGQHDQLTHGSGGRSNYKAGAWRKANAIDRQSILEARYGEMADYAMERGKTSLSREQIIKEAARVDENNLAKRNSEVWINGSNHTISFTGDAKKISENDRKLLFENVDNLQKQYPLDQMDIEVIKDWRNVPGMSKSGAEGATLPDGKKIYLKYNAITGISAENPAELAAIGIQSPWKEGLYMGALTTSPVASYVTAHEWGHAWDSQVANAIGNPGAVGKGSVDRFRYSLAKERTIKQAISDGSSKGGFMSIYGQKNYEEAYAEAFADNFLTNGNSKNAVTQEFKKGFQWK